MEGDSQTINCGRTLKALVDDVSRDIASHQIKTVHFRSSIYQDAYIFCRYGDEMKVDIASNVFQTLFHNFQTLMERICPFKRFTVHDSKRVDIISVTIEHAK
jgi:hypothetical protein